MILEHALLPVEAGSEADFVRESSEYQQWSGLPHSFYDPFPEVEHVTTVPTAAAR